MVKSVLCWLSWPGPTGLARATRVLCAANLCGLVCATFRRLLVLACCNLLTGGFLACELTQLRCPRLPLVVDALHAAIRLARLVCCTKQAAEECRVVAASGGKSALFQERFLGWGGARSATASSAYALRFEPLLKLLERVAAPQSRKCLSAIIDCRLDAVATRAIYPRSSCWQAQDNRARLLRHDPLVRLDLDLLFPQGDAGGTALEPTAASLPLVRPLPEPAEKRADASGVFRTPAVFCTVVVAFGFLARQSPRPVAEGAAS